MRDMYRNDHDLEDAKIFIRKTSIASFTNINKFIRSIFLTIFKFLFINFIFQDYIQRIFSSCDVQMFLWNRWIAQASAVCESIFWIECFLERNTDFKKAGGLKRPPIDRERQSVSNVVYVSRIVHNWAQFDARFVRIKKNHSWLQIRCKH